MSNNPRDTQFAGFAKLLWDEIEQFVDNTEGYIPHNVIKRGPFLETINRLIANRAYDLVEHVLGNEKLKWCPLEDISVSDIPDLTEWPKE